MGGVIAGECRFPEGKYSFESEVFCMFLKVLLPPLSIFRSRQSPSKLPEILYLLMLERVGAGRGELVVSASSVPCASLCGVRSNGKGTSLGKHKARRDGICTQAFGGTVPLKPSLFLERGYCPLSPVHTCV